LFGFTHGLQTFIVSFWWTQRFLFVRLFILAIAPNGHLALCLNSQPLSYKVNAGAKPLECTACPDL